MIKIKYKGETYTFKNFREAHADLDACEWRNECNAAILEHYSDSKTLYDDFGREIGRECLEHTYELESIEVTEEEEVK